MKNHSLYLRLLLLLALCRPEAFSATAVYAVAQAGSLYESTDGAKTWQQIPIAGVPAATYNSALTIDPQNPGNIYLTLVEALTSKPSPTGPQPLRALFRSNDGGQSWSQTSGISSSHVTVDPTSPNTIYADSGTGFVRSTDSGATFGSFTLNLAIMGIAADPNQPGVVYATAGENTRSVSVYKSTDYGSTWTPLGRTVALQGFNIAIDPHNSSILYLPMAGSCATGVTNCGLFRSTDGGKAWASANLPGDFYNVAFDSGSGAIYAAGMLTASVARAAQVVRSTDGGKSWTSLNTGLPAAYPVRIYLDPTAKSTFYAGLVTTAGSAFTGPRGILVSVNSGAAWTLSQVAPQTAPNDAILAMAVASGTPAVSSLKIVSSASLIGGTLASDCLASALGSGLANTTATADPTNPPTTLGGTTVSILDSAGATWQAYLLSVSPTQINFAIPDGVALGPATVVVAPSGAAPQSLQIQIASVAPAVFTLNGSGLVKATVLRISGDQQTYEDVFQLDGSGAVVARPIDLGPDTDQLYLIVIGTGFRAAGTAQTSVSMNGVDAPVSFAGSQGTLVGLDQANVLIPRSLAGSGSVNIVLTAAGQTANTVNLTIQ